ncbi:MAG: efflux RND transporter permease subunit, partial [Sphingomicrobium sp.]
MSRYFIDRPIFAWVLAILVMLFGLLAVRSLPVAQFPALAPPQIGVTAVFPGADATTLDKTTTQIIEQQLQGIDHLRYFSSQSSSSGQVTITLTFEQGTNPDTAQVQVNNKVQAALPLLPQEVQRQGVRVDKSSANFALVPGLYSTDGSHDQNDLGDMMVSKIQEPVSRINGVGNFQSFGSQYAMRIWVDPMKLNSFQLTMADVISAVQAQNAQVSAGQLGSLPAPRSQELNATVSVQSRLQTPDEFGQIRLKTAPDGSVVRLRDVARIELGAENYGFSSNYNGRPATAAVIRLAPGANALKTIGEVKAKIAEIAKQFPSDVKVIYPWDTTPFVKASM